ncbi:MAG: hypothetical protein AAB408_05040, partial [Patescibacteria group bacterium]
IEVILAFRFVLKLFGANPAATFTQIVYGVSNSLARPFLDVFQITTVEGNLFEWTTLVAMAVYWVVGFGISQLLLMSKSVSTPEAARKLGHQTK